jgi:hypothetical protein
MMNQFPTHPYSAKNVGRYVKVGIPPAAKGQGTGLKKPSRPLTAFHIFSQLEKEYIMQGPDRELKQSPLNAFLPRRYHNLDLPYDWCESPGKRRKRKHRKTSSSDNGVTFVEMSRMIAARWAELEKVDMEAKVFCQNIAEQKLHEYRDDLKKYKEVLKAQVASHVQVSKPSQPTHERAPSTDTFVSELGYSYDSPQGNCNKRSVDYTSVFAKNEMEINQCVQYYKKVSNGSTKSPRASSQQAMISPCNSYASASSNSSLASDEEYDRIEIEGARFGEVDLGDDEIIAMFTCKEPVTQVVENRCQDAMDQFFNDFFGS